MLVARLLVQLPLRQLPQVQAKYAFRAKPRLSEIRIQKYAQQTKSSFRTAKESRKTLKEMLMAPATDTAFVVGKGILAGSSAFGLGALCYYGLGLSNELGAIDRAALWPEYVRRRIQNTYLYFTGSVAITALSAYTASRSRTLMRLMMRNSVASLLVTVAVMVGTGTVLHAMPYTDPIGAKQLMWAFHSGLLGTILAPMCLLGGPILIKAAWYTAGVVGSLSLVAACAPSEKFLTVGGPLAIGLGVVFVSSMGTFFLPASTALGAGLYSISMYGGLVVFGGLLLYDTQRIIKMAEWTPERSVLANGKSFDPINASVSIYMDALNIFIRIAHLLAGGGGTGGRR